MKVFHFKRFDSIKVKAQGRVFLLNSIQPEVVASVRVWLLTVFIAMWRSRPGIRFCGFRVTRVRRSQGGLGFLRTIQSAMVFGIQKTIVQAGRLHGGLAFTLKPQRQWLC